MANLGFSNTRVALAFAGMTILGALMMVGTPDNEGVLGQIANRFSTEDVDTNDANDSTVAVQSVNKVANQPGPVWGNTAPVVSDADVRPEGPVVDSQRPLLSPLPPSSRSDPALAPLSPRAIIEDSDDEGYDE